MGHLDIQWVRANRFTEPSPLPQLQPARAKAIVLLDFKARFETLSVLKQYQCTLIDHSANNKQSVDRTVQKYLENGDYSRVLVAEFDTEMNGAKDRSVIEQCRRMMPGHFGKDVVVEGVVFNGCHEKIVFNNGMYKLQ